MRWVLRSALKEMLKLGLDTRIAKWVKKCAEDMSRPQTTDEQKEAFNRDIAAVSKCELSAWCKGIP